MTPRRRLELALALGTAVAVAALDLGTKRWAESSLATPRHLLPVTVPESPGEATAGEIVRQRFPDRTDAALQGTLHLLPEAVALDPEEPVFDIEARRELPPVIGFFVPDRLDAPRFYRRIDRDDAFRMERERMRQRPDLSLPEARRLVRESLAGVTVQSFLQDHLPRLPDGQVREWARRALAPIPPGEAAQDPTRPAEAGRTLLLADREVVLIPGMLDFSYAENPAGAFSMLHDLDEDVRRVLFFVLSLVGLVAIGWLLWKPPAPGLLPMLAMGAILGGAIGNLADRLMLTYVVDFIHMYWKDWHWPRYNVADIGISVGVVLLVLISSRSPAKEKGPS
ncbi:signal peptidase II [Myxococcota bacterium]|nr:signal peptidase II [Myxococcota bacterium]